MANKPLTPGQRHALMLVAEVLRERNIVSVCLCDDEGLYTAKGSFVLTTYDVAEEATNPDAAPAEHPPNVTLLAAVEKLGDGK